MIMAKIVVTISLHDIEIPINIIIHWFENTRLHWRRFKDSDAEP